MLKVDFDGLFCVDGWLQYVENFFYDVCFFVILLRGNWVIKLIVKYYYEVGYYIIGINYIFVNFLIKYWIVVV